MNFEPTTANKTAIIITDIKIIINSISEEKTISFLEKPKILKTKFWYSLTFPWTIIALDITIKPMTIVTVEITITAMKTLFKTLVTLFK